MFLVALAAFYVLTLDLTGESAGEPAPAVRRVPDLGGLTVAEAVAVLDDAGFSGWARTLGSLETYWVANESAPRGVVTAQAPPAGSEMDVRSFVRVEVSAGGPVIAFEDLAADVAQWIVGRSRGTFDVTEPILLVETELGTVYKTDDYLFGRCDAVGTAMWSFEDQAYAPVCIPARSTAVTGRLPDGTGYEVEGLPPGEYLPVWASAEIVIETEHGPLPFGIADYWQGLVRAEPQVYWGETTILVMTAGGWIARVEVRGSLLRPMPPSQREHLLDSIRAADRSGHLVFELAPPLGFGSEGPMFVDYGSFRVRSGCPDAGSLRPPSIVCDPTGTISLGQMVPAVAAEMPSIRMSPPDLQGDR